MLDDVIMDRLRNYEVVLGGDFASLVKDTTCPQEIQPFLTYFVTNLESMRSTAQRFANRELTALDVVNVLLNMTSSMIENRLSRRHIKAAIELVPTLIRVAMRNEVHASEAISAYSSATETISANLG